MPDLVVIGGGTNGLAAATQLARGGRRVLLLERSAELGGLDARVEFHPGFACSALSLDTDGLRREVAAELDLAAHGLRWRANEADVLAPASDGPGLIASRAPDLTPTLSVEGLSAADAKALESFNARIARFSSFFGRLVDEPAADPELPNRAAAWQLFKSAVALRRLGQEDMLELLRIAPMCIADWLAETFQCTRLRALLAAPALSGTWLGPWSAGSTALALLRECTRQRSVEGGPTALSAALVSAAQAAGVELVSAASVKEIRVEAGAVRGVRLADGTPIDARAVLSTADPKRSLLGLLPRGQLGPELEKRLRNWRTRGSTAKLDLALDAPLEFACRPGLSVERAQIAGEIDDLERAFDALKYRELPRRPWLDVAVPSLNDPTLAPPGKALASILVHFVPYDLKHGWGESQRNELFELVIATLEVHVPDLRQRILAWQCLTPLDLEERYALSGGQIQHGETALDQLFHMRPSPECAHYATPIRGLFLGGSGSHPGAGFPCSAGLLAARSLARAWGSLRRD